MAPSDRITRLVLVRHGHAQAQERSVVGGHQGCTGLTERGRRQAERLRDRFVASGYRPDVVVTSVLPRAIETADIVAGGLELDAARIPHDCELCERHPGEGDGLTWSAFVERYGAVDPLLEPDLPPSPGGESTTEFHDRVNDVLDRLAKEHEGLTVLVVCHGGVILAATIQLLGIPLGRFTPDIPHTSITEWWRDDRGWMLARLNDVAHLEGLDPKAGGLHRR
jgi:ribonuclease H / adenosylcobalamin/alpha-ribazole phosphatase